MFAGLKRGNMSDSENNSELEALEAELKKVLAQGNHLDAIDIYEEISDLGALTPQHLLDMGHSYLELRKKSDAKTMWMRARELDPEFEPAVKELNKNFPGWRKAAPKIESFAPPSADDSSKAAKGPASVKTKSGDKDGAGGGGGGDGGDGAGKGAGGNVNLAGVGSFTGDEVVCWQYIMEDLQEALASGGR